SSASCTPARPRARSSRRPAPPERRDRLSARVARGSRGVEAPMNRKRIGVVTIVVCVCLAFVFHAAAQEQAAQKPQSARDPAPARDTTAPSIEGVYVVEGGTERVRVKRISDGIFYVAAEGWEGVGILDGAIYRGVFRDRTTPDAPTGAMGEQTIDWRDPANPAMKAAYTTRRAEHFSQRWRRLGGPGELTEGKQPHIGVIPPQPGSGPDYIYVDDLPEAITKVEPVYPDPRGQQARIEGTVLLQVHVLEDGSVGECKIVKSIPTLDAAAIECVRKWKFKPALAKGVPTAVWVAVPIRFAPH